jgi:rubrerythrin
MNLLNIIDEIEKIDPEVYDRLDGRRAAMKKFMSFSGKVAAASVPVALGTMLSKAYGQTPPPTIPEVLNFALTLEYLEWRFYVQAVNSGIIPNSTALAALTTIRDHEEDHVNFLTSVITSLGATPVYFTDASFDYTAHGTFPNPFATGNYGFMLAIAQTFEDTGVRAYKGQAANLISSNEILRAALRIHSVEARHASHLREMRRRTGLLVPGGVLLQPWITLNQSGIDSTDVQASYNGEETINIANVGFGVTSEDVTEAFDEPLTMSQVQGIVAPFFV